MHKGMPPRDGGLMKALDLNGDRMLDKAELTAAAESLKTLDADQDGLISKTELCPQPPEGGPKHCKQGLKSEPPEQTEE